MYQVLKETWEFILEAGLPFWRPLALPLCLCLLFDFLPDYLFEGTIGSITFQLVSLVLAALLMSNVHRLVILGPQSIPKIGIHSQVNRIANFCGYVLFIVLIFAITSGVILTAALNLFENQALLPIYYSVGLLVSAVISSRFCLVLPAASLDQHMHLSDSWKVTRDSKATATAVFIILPFGLGRLVEPFYLEDILISQLLVNTISLLLLIFGVVCLSKYYQHVVLSGAA